MRCFQRKNIWFAVILLMIGSVVGCSVHEPRPVDLEGLDDIQPHEVIQREKPDATPRSVVIKEKLAPIVQDMQADTTIYSGTFGDVALAAEVGAGEDEAGGVFNDVAEFGEHGGGAFLEWLGELLPDIAVEDDRSGAGNEGSQGGGFFDPGNRMAKMEVG